MAFDPYEYAQYLIDASASPPSQRKGMRPSSVSDILAGATTPSVAPAPLPPPTYGSDITNNMSAAKDRTDAMMYRGLKELGPKATEQWAAEQEAANIAEANQAQQKVSPESQQALEGMQWEGGVTGGFKAPSMKGLGLAASSALSNVPTIAGIGAGALLAGAGAVPAAIGTGLAAGIPGAFMGSGDAAQTAEQRGREMGLSQDALNQATHEAAVSEFVPSFIANAAGSAIEGAQMFKQAKSLKRAVSELDAPTQAVSTAAAAANKSSGVAEVLGRVGTSALAEGITEGGEAAATAMSVNAALKQPLMDDSVVNAGLGEGLVGAVTGGGSTAVVAAPKVALDNIAAQSVGADKGETQEFSQEQLDLEKALAGEQDKAIDTNAVDYFRSLRDRLDTNGHSALRASLEQSWADQGKPNMFDDATLDAMKAQTDQNALEAKSLSSYMAQAYKAAGTPEEQKTVAGVARQIMNAPTLMAPHFAVNFLQEVNGDKAWADAFGGSFSDAEKNALHAVRTAGESHKVKPLSSKQWIGSNLDGTSGVMGAVAKIYNTIVSGTATPDLIEKELGSVKKNDVYQQTLANIFMHISDTSAAAVAGQSETDQAAPATDPFADYRAIFERRSSAAAAAAGTPAGSQSVDRGFDVGEPKIDASSESVDAALKAAAGTEDLKPDDTTDTGAPAPGDAPLTPGGAPTAAPVVVGSPAESVSEGEGKPEGEIESKVEGETEGAPEDKPALTGQEKKIADTLSAIDTAGHTSRTYNNSLEAGKAIEAVTGIIKKARLGKRLSVTKEVKDGKYVIKVSQLAADTTEKPAKSGKNSSAPDQEVVTEQIAESQATEQPAVSETDRVKAATDRLNAIADEAIGHAADAQRMAKSAGVAGKPKEVAYFQKLAAEAEHLAEKFSNLYGNSQHAGEKSRAAKNSADAVERLDRHLTAFVAAKGLSDEKNLKKTNEQKLAAARDAAYKELVAKSSSSVTSGEKTSTTTDQVHAALKSWWLGDRAKLNVVQTASEAGLPEGTKGRYDRGTKTVTLVADRLSDEGDIRATLLHEMGVHYGFTMKEIAQYAAQIKSWATAAEGTMQRKVYDAAMARVEAADRFLMKNKGVRLSEAGRDEELVAYAVETAVNLKVSPASVVGVMLKRLAATIASFFGVQSLSVQDLVNYAYAAAHSSEAQERRASAYSTATDEGMDSLAGPQLTAVAKAVKDNMANEHGITATVGKMFSKYFTALQTQIVQRLSKSPALKMIGQAISDMMWKYQDSKKFEASLIMEKFKPTVSKLVGLSKVDKNGYKFMVAALKSELTRAELEKQPSMKAAMDKVYTIKGEAITGWGLLKETREQMRSMVTHAAKRGVFIFNNKDTSAAITDPSKEATYWPRALDVAKVREKSDELIELILNNQTVMSEMGWANKFTPAEQRDKVRAFVDVLATRGFDDPVMTSVMYGLNKNVLRKSGQILNVMSGFREDDEKLAIVLAKAFAHKNRRTMSDSVADALSEFYKNDVKDVMTAYATSLGTRIATHEHVGGWISNDRRTYAPNRFAASARFENEVALQRAANPSKPDWWHRAHAAERMAESGGLFYSPTARADFLVQRAYDKGASADTKNWMVDTYFPAQFNQLGQDIDPTVRTMQDYAMAGIKFPLLMFAQLTSIVEVGNLATRRANPALGKGVMSSLAKAAGTVAHLMFTPSGWKAIRDSHDSILGTIGVVHDASFRMAHASMDTSKIASGKLRKFTDAYFKYTALNLWTNIVAQAAYSIAQTEVESYFKLGQAGLKEAAALGITQQQWEAFKQDRLPEGADKETQFEHANKHRDVYRGLAKWVDGARLSPNPQTRTGWGNNPKYALLWMLNDFPYAFGSVTLDRVISQYRSNPQFLSAILPVITTGMMFTLLGMFSNILKDSIRGTASGEPPRFTKEDLITQAYRSAMGPGSVAGQYEKIFKFVEHAYNDYQGNPFLHTFGGPAVSTVLGMDTVGLARTLINETSVLTRAQKKDMATEVNQLFGT